MMRRYGRNTSDISPEQIRGLNVSADLNTTNENINVSLYAGPIELSFSSSNSSPESNQDEENSIISNDSSSSSSNNETDEESERNGIDLNAIMNHIDDCGRHIKRNLTDIVRVELENLLYSLQPRKPLVPYPLSSSEEL
uniref:Uncharacterized protein n=1 Tax=Panagrolaimus sp. PS1159 TaxID=55785 RepID=A0AC35FEA0_9BILA